MLLYLTADRVGAETGGGKVTANELAALGTLGPVRAVRPSREDLGPFDQDADVLRQLQGKERNWIKHGDPELAHCYAGCLTETVRWLKGIGAKVSYTAAAHDVAESRREHESLGLPFDYPHLNDPKLWDRYVGGYLEADLVVCPSRHSAKVMDGFGCRRIEIIPHGVDLPAEAPPLPKAFGVGYMGSWGPDKGVRYLLEAWKRLAFPDARLVLAGRDSASPWATYLIERFGGGNVWCMGWVDDPVDFWREISILVQPSVTEGFGLEVLESLANGRPVICSGGAGAVDLIRHRENGLILPAGSSGRIAQAIKEYKEDPKMIAAHGKVGREETAPQLTWGKVRERYAEAWRGLLA